MLIGPVVALRVIAMLTLLLAGSMAAPRALLAQGFDGVDLQWRGPALCAEPAPVLEMARAAMGTSWPTDPTLKVSVVVEEAADGSMTLSFEAQRKEGAVRRSLRVASCDEARRAAALLVSLSLDAQSEPALPEVKPAPVAAEPAETSVERPVAAEPEPEPEPEPAARRSGWTLGIAGGLEAPVVSSISGVLAAWTGWRWSAIELGVAAKVWSPVQHEVKAVDVQVDQIGASISACYWFSFGAWELGPSLGLLLASVSTQLNGADAGTKPWVRAAPSLQLTAWLSEHLALRLATEVLIALHQPRFSAADGASAQTPAFGFSSQAGMVWAP